MHIAWENFTPYLSLTGGLLIGLAAVLLLLGNGRIAGISGIVGGLIEGTERSWRAAFVIGLLLSPWLWQLFAPLPVSQLTDSSLYLVGAGLLVGFGSRLGSGCTSGHGVCGLPRGSVRSLVATLCFMGAAMATVFICRHML